MPLPLPDGMHSVTPYLVVEDPEALIAFLQHVFAANEIERSTFEGRMTHAEVRIGDTIIMIGGARDGTAFPAMLYVYVDDCDAAYHRAIDYGAESVSPPADMYYGDRHAGVRDAHGNTWWIATHIEDVAPEELARRHEIEQQRRRERSAAVSEV